MNHPEHQYLALLRDCMDNGIYREGRNGGTYGLFGRQMRFDLNEGFPLLTTKRVHTKSVVSELLWLLSGETNIERMKNDGVTIWDDWADKNGELGPVYGKQWRRWEGHEGHIDQITNVIEGLKKDPYGRRHIVTAWNPADLPFMALPPCHAFFQFFVADGKLSCQLYQRSADVFLGVPFNIASYALLTHLIARETGLQVGEFVHTLGDVHLYANHVEAATTQLEREPGVLPHLFIASSKGIFELETADIEFRHYHPAATIKAEVSA